jgi:predicted nuclease of predicted toxin-antitoxin system
MLKFLIDESAGLYVSTELKKDGFDVVSIIETTPGIKNGNVLEKANREGRILVTNDKDFGELIYRQEKHSQGIILLRLEIDTPEARLLLLRKIIRTYGEKIQNKFIVATETKIKIRSLL